MSIENKPVVTETDEERRRREREESERRAAEAERADRRNQGDDRPILDLRIGGLRGSPD